MTFGANFVLAQRQREARRLAQLPFHQIDAADRLGDRMLDLQARVHLEEVGRVLFRAHDKLDRSSAGIADIGGQRDSAAQQRRAHIRGKVRRGRFFDDLLVVALDRAVALEEMERGALTIAEDLDFDMTRFLDQLFQEDRAVAEGRRGFVARRGNGGQKFFRLEDAPHAAAPAASAGLDQDWIADLGCRGGEIGIARIGSIETRNHRHAGGLSNSARFNFRAHLRDAVGRRSDENQTGRLDRRDKSRVFRKEAVPRMNRIGAGGFGGRDDFRDRKVAVRGLRGAEFIGRICQAHVARGLVGLGIDRDGGQAETSASGDDAAGDLAAVGDEHAADWAWRCEKFSHRHHIL